jgi:pimeloyl-ACP methyl ester carboxylesterase
VGGLVVLVCVAVGVVSFLSTADLPHDVVRKQYGQAPSRFAVWPDGTRIHYRDQGKPDAPPILLLHGSNASLHTWEGWVRVLSPMYRVITVDLPGHGLTGETASKQYGYDGMTVFLERFVRSLKLSRFVLGGNSMGGALAWKYTLAHPAQVRALILVDAAGVPRKQAGRLPLAFRLARIPILRNLILYITPRSLVAEGLARSYGDPTKITDALVEQYHKLALHKGNRTATVARFATYTTDVSIPPLSQIKAPTLILWGQKDLVTPLDMSEIFLRQIQGSKRIVYPTLGHIPMEEDPQSTVRDVLAFLKQLGAVSPRNPPHTRSVKPL